MSLLTICRRLAGVFGLGILLAGCAAPTTAPDLPTAPPATQAAQPTSTPEPSATTALPTRAASAAMLTIYPDQPLQVIREVGGGNFIHRFGGVRSAFDPVSEANWRTLGPDVVRVAIDLDEWEPVNDNSDATLAEAAAFKDEEGSALHATFLFLQEVHRQDVQIVASVWRVPGWMVENPDESSGQVIPRELYPEAVEAITAWLARARDVYGAEVDYISFNEANLGVNVLLTPEDYVEMIRQASARFAGESIQTKWLIGDTSNMAESAAYAGAIWAAEDIRGSLGPLAFHSWDASAPDAVLQRIGALGEQMGREAWCTEGGWDAQMWQRPEQFVKFTHALNLAAVYARVLKLTRATTLLYWEMMGSDYPLNPGERGDPYPSLYFLSELKRQFPAGSQVLGTSADRSSLKFTAAREGDHIAVLMVNQALAEKVILQGLPDGRYYLKQSSSKAPGFFPEVAVVEVTGGQAQFELAGFSISFFTSRTPLP